MRSYKVSLGLNSSCRRGSWVIQSQFGDTTVERISYERGTHVMVISYREEILLGGICYERGFLTSEEPL